MDKINVTNKIEKKNGKLMVPDTPTVPFITGDGVGAEITPVCQQVVDAAVEKAYGGKRKIVWKEVLAGGKAHEQTQYEPAITIAIQPRFTYDLFFIQPTDTAHFAKRKIFSATSAGIDLSSIS